jgi:hypothetical protein
MNKLLLIALAVVCFAGCNSKEAGTSTTDVTMSMKPSYSSSFTMGNQKYAAMVVQGSWKDWDDNKMDSMKNWMADTVVAFQSDNKMIKGLDSLTAYWKKGRAMYTSITDTLNAAMAVHSTDKNEDWALVWVTSMSTDTSGKRDTSYYQETWRFNKDGKADLLYQYDRGNRKH